MSSAEFLPGMLSVNSVTRQIDLTFSNINTNWSSLDTYQLSSWISLRMLGKRFSCQHFEFFFFCFFFLLEIWHFMQTGDNFHEMSNPKETICKKGKFLFLGKIKEKNNNNNNKKHQFVVCWIAHSREHIHFKLLGKYCQKYRKLS